jgi:transcriptional regulator with XRE-family HTH domain
MPNASAAHNAPGRIISMSGTQPKNLAFSHFGRQMRKERLARGWSLPELGARMGAFNNGQGIDHGHLSRIERGVRPPTENIADLCDQVFPERKGWFREYYEESKSWTPPGLRSWAEHEDKAARLSVWAPGIVHGLFQTKDYARGFIDALPGVTDDVAAVMLANRMERQRRVLYRKDEPPLVSCIIDHTALYRLVGSPEIMAAEMRHLVQVAKLPNVTIQVLPAVAHPATASELIIADNNAAYAEHLAAGGVYTEDETVARLEKIFARIHGECYRVSESLAVIRKAEEIWTGASPPTAGPTGLA